MSGAIYQCKDPCLEECDPDTDCCCRSLGVLGVTNISSTPTGSYYEITAVTLTWNVPIPQCVLDRAGVSDVSELELLVWLSGDPYNDEPDITLTGTEVTDGRLEITRAQMALPIAQACLADVALDIHVGVRNQHGVTTLSCPACPEPDCDQDYDPGCSCQLRIDVLDCCWNGLSSGESMHTTTPPALDLGGCGVIDADAGSKRRLYITVTVTPTGACPPDPPLSLYDPGFTITVVANPSYYLLSPNTYHSVAGDPVYSMSIEVDVLAFSEFGPVESPQAVTYTISAFYNNPEATPNPLACSNTLVINGQLCD